jgi:hypothetical protein
MPVSQAAQGNNLLGHFFCTTTNASVLVEASCDPLRENKDDGFSRIADDQGNGAVSLFVHCETTRVMNP